MSFFVDHNVYERVCENLFAKPQVIFGGVSAKPLAHDIGTSVVPVREALIRLAQQDALDNIPSKGFFIPPLRARHLEQAFDTARKLLDTRHVKVTQENDFDLDEIIFHNAILASHWSAFTDDPVLDNSNIVMTDKHLDFDRKFLTLISKVSDEADWKIMRYILGNTIQYRYHIYSNFSLYSASQGVKRRYSGRGLVIDFIEDVFSRYASLSREVAQMASANQRPSPYM